MSEVKTNKISSLASNNDITLDPDGTGDVVVASGHKLGVGTAPAKPLHVNSGTGNVVIRCESTDSEAEIEFVDNNTGANTPRIGGVGNALFFQTGTSQVARFDSSGNLLVGNSTFGAEDGVYISQGGNYVWARSDDTSGYFDRTGSDGKILELRKDGTTVGVIMTASSYLAIGDDCGLLFNNANPSFTPFNAITSSNADNSIDLGVSNARFDDIFATNSTIQTSDQNEKEQIASLTTAEITAAKAISKLFKTFKWQDKVAAKGDAARRHAGVIAQEVQTAMSDAGLDASKYAFWCSDTWWETSTEVAAVEADEEAGIEARDAYTRVDTYDTAEEAPEGATQRTRLGVRYPELLAFIGAATEQRLADIETRLTALEAGE